LIKTKKKPINYVDKKQFYQAIVEYHAKLKKARDGGVVEPRIPDYIGSCLQKIAYGLASKRCFANYSFIDEMISDAIENCIMYFEDFDPEWGQNAFSYFTQVVYFAFLRRIYKEEKGRYIKYKYFQEAVLHGRGAHLFVDADGEHLITTKVYDNINDFIEKFEKKEELKKEKRRLSRQAKKADKAIGEGNEQQHHTRTD
jgi:hypothetical protein